MLCLANDKEKATVESNSVYEDLRKHGLTPGQIESLRRLRKAYAERELIAVERRRLEFARWLVSTGRLTDELTISRK